jgi:hypothetical protein
MENISSESNIPSVSNMLALLRTSVWLCRSFPLPDDNFSGYRNRDVWGQSGAYYGSVITTGAGGR